MGFFEGFELTTMRVSDGELRLRHGGSGPPLLVLHGNPQNYWFWFAQPHPFPEELINAAPETWFRIHTSREPKPPGFFREEALADYLSAARNPDAITGMCEDYRAAASINMMHDRVSRANRRRVQCPMLVLWAAKDASAAGMTCWPSGATIATPKLPAPPCTAGTTWPRRRQARSWRTCAHSSK